MELERIRKRPEEYVGANLVDYDECAKTFSWTQARGILDGLPGGGLNIAHEAIDRHVKAGRGDKLALRWIGRDDSIRDFTYATLGAAVNRFANVLTQYGIAKGDRVSSLLGRVPELYIGALGTLKNGSVFSLFRFRTGADQSAHDDRQRQRSHHHRSVLPPQNRALAQGARELKIYLLD